MEKEEKNRESQFELLRILAMVLIIIHHYAIHGGILEAEVRTTNKYVAVLIYSFGQVAVNVFILITGYFLIDSKFKIKKLFKLIFQVLFYTISVLILYIIFKGIPNWYTVKTCLFPITSGTYWFITSYVCLYCLSPFLNILIKNLNKENHRTIIILLTFFLSRNRI